MKCPKCNSEISDTAKFCHVCGNAMIGANPVENEPTVSSVDAPQYQPAPEQQYQQFQPPQQYQRAPGSTYGSPQYAQQYQQFQQSNQQYKNPQYQGNYQNASIQPAGKKTNVIPIIAIAAAALLVIGGIITALILIFSGGGSTKVVDDFTMAVNTRDVSYLKKDMFIEDSNVLTTAVLESALGSIPAGHQISSQVISTEVIKPNDPMFHRYANAVFEKYPSVIEENNITERNIITVNFIVTDGSETESKYMYFDVAKCSGEWKIVDLETSRSALSYLN